MQEFIIDIITSGGTYMEKETTAKVISVSKQKWIKINTKPIRKNSSDSAIYPHIIKISYNVDGNEYIKRKFIGAGYPVPSVGSHIKVIYDENKPSKVKINIYNT